MSVAYLLGRGSAVEWLRRNHDMPLLQNRWNVVYAMLEGSRTKLDAHLPLMEGLTRPYQLVVWTRNDRRRTSWAQTHVLTTQDGLYPAIRLSQDLFVSTPEFTFLQMASVLDEEQLLFLGCELCGRYGIDGTVFLRDQVCSPSMLIAFCEHEAYVRGRRKALAVAPRILPGAASPMEVALALLLSSPREQGGYGLAAPELNHPLPVRGRTRAIWPFGHITPDLLWEQAKLVIEYDSNEGHAASTAIARDAKRRDVLVDLGYRVITVTTEHMRTVSETDRIATMVANALGTDLVAEDASGQKRRRDYLGRLRTMALHPERLAAIPQPKNARSWNPRRPSGKGRSTSA